MNDEILLDHSVIEQLKLYSQFYNELSDSSMNFISMGIPVCSSSMFNIDCYIFSSMSETLRSIKELLQKGRVNDAYALLRKYYDAVIINLYANIYLHDNFSLEQFVVEKINAWVGGKEKIPSFRTMSEYILNSPIVSKITELLYEDKEYQGSMFYHIRERCNGHLHYFYFYNLCLNIGDMYSQEKLQIFDRLSVDLQEIFILHLSYLFYFKDCYMMSSDYGDYMDCGMTPEEDCQYWVAPFIQEIFDKVIKPYRFGVAEAIKEASLMHLVL